MNDDSLERDAAVARIDALVERDRLKHARAELERAMQLYPDDADLLFLSAYIDYREDRNRYAQSTLSDLLEIEPDSHRAMRLMANLKIEAERYAEAERLLLAVLRKHPAGADTLAAYSELMLRTMHVDKAEQLAREALRLAPDDPDAQRALLLAAIVNRDDETIDGTLTSMLRARPDKIATTLSLLQVLWSQSRPRDAERIAREVLAVAPDNPHVLNTVQTLRARNHWSMIPLWPVLKFGWAGSIAIWLIAVLYFSFAPPGRVTTGVLIALLAYVVYSWVWPPLLARWIRR